MGILAPRALQANLHSQLTAAGDDVLAVLLSGATHERVGLRQPHQAIDQFQQILAVIVLILDRDLHDWRHAVPLARDVVSILQGRQGHMKS